MILTTGHDGKGIQIQTCQDTGKVKVDGRIAFLCDYSVSIDGDNCLNVLRQLHRFPLAVFVSLGWPLALKQNASFLTEGIPQEMHALLTAPYVSRCWALSVHSRALKAIL